MGGYAGGDSDNCQSRKFCSEYRRQSANAHDIRYDFDAPEALLSLYIDKDISGDPTHATSLTVELDTSTVQWPDARKSQGLGARLQLAGQMTDSRDNGHSGMS